jgi:hypothetical protein
VFRPALKAVELAIPAAAWKTRRPQVRSPH